MDRLEKCNIVEEVKKGRVEYRTDSFGNVHAIIGKVSFDETKLVQNGYFN